MRQVVTLASIVEKETARASDRPLVASVLVNRLRLGMRLQSDPTVIYGLGVRFDGNLRKRDLEEDTPYNTRLNTGLPPTPIGNPGLASIKAAAKPSSKKYLFYVRKPNQSGEHLHENAPRRGFAQIAIGTAAEGQLLVSRRKIGARVRDDGQTV